MKSNSIKIRDIPREKYMLDNNKRHSIRNIYVIKSKENIYDKKKVNFQKIDDIVF